MIRTENNLDNIVNKLSVVLLSVHTSKTYSRIVVACPAFGSMTPKALKIQEIPNKNRTANAPDRRFPKEVSTTENKKNNCKMS